MSLLACFSCLMVAGIARPVAAPAEPGAGTPPEMVATYQTLADTILGAKKTEHNLVKSILSATYRHAEATLSMAKASIASGKDAKGAVEKLASLVSQLGNEGDAAVAAVRTRLLEGGHHHNAEGEKQGIYDDGYVIVTRAAKKAFLDSSMKIGKLAMAPDAKALDAEWAAVSKQFNDLVK